MNSILKAVLALYLVIPSSLAAQIAGIQSINLQIHASINKEPLAWASNTAEIIVNKHTGEFEVRLLIDNLRMAITNPKFTGYTGENLGKYLTLKGIIPVIDVLDDNSTVLDLKVELTANFNNLDYPTIFTFSILRVQEQDRGFSVMMKGSISHSALKIDNLKQLDDELVIAISFVGF